MIDWLKPDYTDVIDIRRKALSKIRSGEICLGNIKQYYMDHPADFISDWGMTYDPRNAEIGLNPTIPFCLYPKQVEMVNWIHERWKNREDGAILKSRDVGLSWICVGMATWLYLFHQGTCVGFGSRKAEYVDNIGDFKSLFPKIRKFIELLPFEFKPKGYNERRHSKQMLILNPHNGSSIIGEGGDNIGRGGRSSIYYVDEAAYLERPEMIEASLSQTSNCKIFLSSPNGVGNPFHDKVINNKIPVFKFHWKDDPRKTQEWYDKECEKYPKWLIAQELDLDFTVSGRPVFDRELLALLSRECYKPKHRMVFRNKGFIDQKEGELRIWEKPKPGMKYAMGADVAEGLVYGDYSCADVLDKDGYQVAQWHGHVAPDMFGEILYHLGMMYNKAYLGVERNNHGLTTLVKLRDLYYPHLHAERYLTDRGSGDREKKDFGWLTTHKSKPLIIDMLDAEIRSKDSGVCCSETVDEMRNFIVNEKGGYEAQQNCHDDRVMSRAIAGQMLKSSYL